MKLNGTPPHYMPLSQSQSDEEESVASKSQNFDKSVCFKGRTITDSFEKKTEIFDSPADPKCLPMSPLRTVAFVLSLIACVSFISIFLWLLPCNPLHFDVEVLEEWTKVFENLTFTSGITLAATSNKTNPILLLGYSFWENETSVETGVIGVRKSNGAKMWKQTLPSEPVSILCSGVDVDSDGFPDCLIYGSDGLLSAISVVKGGNIIWYIHNHKKVQLLDGFSIPSVVPDCDGDDIPDILISYSNERNQSFLALVSGRTGEIKIFPVHVESCVSPIQASLTMEWQNTTAFIFYCSRGLSGDVLLTDTQDICNVALNKQKKIKITEIYRTAPFFSDIQLQKSILNDNLVIIINGSTVVLLQSTVTGKFKVRWTMNFKSNRHWRSVENGKRNTELVLVGTDAFNSKVIALNMSNGHRLWTTEFNGSIVTSFLSMSDVFENVSAILLKILTTLDPQFKENEKRKNIENTTTTDIYDSNSSNEFHLRVVKESYVLLHSNISVKNLSVRNISQMCKGSVCMPDLYSSRMTAAAVMSNDGAVDVTFVSSSLTSSQTFSNFQSAIKVIKLKNLKTFPKCMYRFDS